jgi:transcriptional regulator with XRE-family HTH domain
MQPRTTGRYLSELRKKRQRSLRHVALRTGRKRLSKQALSLIEKGRMRIPAARLEALKRAYELSLAEEKELSRLYAFEQLVEHTGEDREFGEAVLSVVDPENTTVIYVIGGRKLSLASPLLQKTASECLQRPGNRLVFLYPRWSSFFGTGRPIWFPNTHREMSGIREAVQSFSKRPIESQIEFYGLNVQETKADSALMSVLSLCNPFTAMTVASSPPSDRVAGYIYVEGPRDRWILLKPENAKRAFDAITLLLNTPARRGSVVLEHLP